MPTKSKRTHKIIRWGNFTLCVPISTPDNYWDLQLEEERRRCENLRGLGNSIRQAEIDRICARHELESDEFYTREQKAERYLRHS